jgi:protein phosphatase
VALRIVEQAGLTDVGRQRHANEDSYFQRPPLFAVADGMGGAKAGEVASRIAVETFEEAGDAIAAPERRLEELAREANRRIYDKAQSDEAHRGMGTTLTSAFVGDKEVSIGHVGDSRAYRLRDGGLDQLTHDHSLVAELERTGQLSSAEAEHHPQKSIITRALGPEPDVLVDTHTHTARPGDVYLLCSDGLTSMLSEDEVARILRGADSLDAAAEALVRAANQSGGKDNITVILFRLEEAEDAPGAGTLDEESTIAGQLSADDVRAGGSEAPPPKLEPLPSEPAPVRHRPAASAPRRHRARRAIATVVGLALLAGVAFGLWTASRSVYFVGTNDAGLVTLYKGLPYELPLGVELYEEEYASGVPARAIPRTRRERVLDHEWRGQDDAVDLVRSLEQGRLEQ